MNYSIIITCVLVAIATSYMTGNARKNTAAARTPDGMRVLRNKRLGVVALVTMVAIGAGLMGLGVLCFLDIGLGQGGIVLAFFGLGAGMVLLATVFALTRRRSSGTGPLARRCRSSGARWSATAAIPGGPLSPPRTGGGSLLTTPLTGCRSWWR